MNRPRRASAPPVMITALAPKAVKKFDKNFSSNLGFTSMHFRQNCAPGCDSGYEAVDAEADDQKSIWKPDKENEKGFPLTLEEYLGVELLARNFNTKCLPAELLHIVIDQAFLLHPRLITVSHNCGLWSGGWGGNGGADISFEITISASMYPTLKQVSKLFHDRGNELSSTSPAHNRTSSILATHDISSRSKGSDIPAYINWNGVNINPSNDMIFFNYPYPQLIIDLVARFPMFTKLLTTLVFDVDQEGDILTWNDLLLLPALRYVYIIKRAPPWRHTDVSLELRPAGDKHKAYFTGKKAFDRFAGWAGLAEADKARVKVEYAVEVRRRDGRLDVPLPSKEWIHEQLLAEFSG